MLDLPRANARDFARAEKKHENVRRQTYDTVGAAINQRCPKNVNLALICLLSLFSRKYFLKLQSKIRIINHGFCANRNIFTRTHFNNSNLLYFDLIHD